jgi:hypothetical protein
MFRYERALLVVASAAMATVVADVTVVPSYRAGAATASVRSASPPSVGRAAPLAADAAGRTVPGGLRRPTSPPVRTAAPTAASAHVRKPAARHTATVHAQTARSTRTTTKASARTVRTYHISGVVRGTQATIDSCHIVLWANTSPPGSAGMTWLAAHNVCGGRSLAQWWAYLPVGAHVTVSGLGRTGKYVVTGHRYLARQTGNAPLDALHGNLILQTCLGRGTEFTYGRLLS